MVYSVEDSLPHISPQVESWFRVRNLPPLRFDEGRRESLTYALVVFIRRPNELPPELSLFLAEYVGRQQGVAEA